MMIKFRTLAVMAIFTIALKSANGQTFSSDVVLSAIKGKESKPATLIIPKGTVPVGDVKITGTGKSAFKIVSLTKPTNKSGNVVLQYMPAADFVGIQKASVTVTAVSGKQVRAYAITGLSSNGLEGANEVPLATIIDALGYKTNPGWTALSNNIKSVPQGDEVMADLFKKAGPGKVDMIPVARYSPDFELSFGYYTNTNHAPDLNVVGILTKTDKYVEHQTLFPDLAKGETSFDPGTAAFGFYATGPDHTAYSENVWNMALHPANAEHATRIYPVKDKLGKVLANTYLVCFEEAKNGDYNDYVFLVKNVKPATENLYTMVFNGKDLTGWDMFLRGVGTNKDPDKVFNVQDGMLFVTGKIPGYVISKKSFTDYHLKVDFKWGEKKWPPRENAKRDAGICYNIATAVPDSLWPASIECQIQEGDVGDFWMLGFSTMKVGGKVNRPTNHIQAVKLKDNENPTGQWNTVEVISYKGRCVNIVNGEVVNYGEEASVKNGRFLLQSEFSEVYYKNVKIREL